MQPFTSHIVRVGAHTVSSACTALESYSRVPAQMRGENRIPTYKGMESAQEMPERNGTSTLQHW